jgi:hypothetical protein
MLISDSGSESILKFVLAKEGLSGMSPFEQEVSITSKERQGTRRSFAEKLGMLFQAKDSRYKTVRSAN